MRPLLRPTARPPLVGQWAAPHVDSVPRPLAVQPSGGAAGLILHTPGLSAQQVAKRLRKEDVPRDRAYAIFASFLAAHVTHSKFATRMAEEGETFDASSRSLVAALGPKRSETVRKRAGSLRAYVSWLRSSGHTGAPLAEPAVFDYMAFLIDERAAATRASTTRQMVSFMGGVLGFDTAEATKSSRIRGLAVKLQERRGVFTQKDPLPVRLVRMLEEVVVGEAPDEEIAIAGLALFGTYARCRVGDLLLCCTEPKLDLAKDRGSGYCESALAWHKTARPGQRQHLPIVAPAFGVLGQNWAEPWLAARARLGLHASTGTLVQAPTAEGAWSQAPMRTTEFACALRGLLHDRGVGPKDLARIGSQSLKPTLLSWAAKRGLPRGDRRLLGYHIKKGDHTMEAYSRDSQASPLRALVGMISEVAKGEFAPDETRSGQIHARRAASDHSSSPSVMSRSSSSADPEPASDIDGVAEALIQDEFLVNTRSKRVHVKRSDGTLVCGMDVPKDFVLHKSVPNEVSLRFCTGCF